MTWLSKEEQEAILALHAKGRSTAGIARDLDFSAGTIKRILKSKGLKGNGHDPESIRMIAKNNTAREKRHISNISSLRHRGEAKQLGWPQCRSAASAMIMQCLMGGAKTKREIAVELGRKITNRRENRTVSIHINNLVADGLVVKDRSSPCNGGSVSVWKIADHVMTARNYKEE